MGAMGDSDLGRGNSGRSGAGDEGKIVRGGKDFQVIGEMRIQDGETQPHGEEEGERRWVE